MFNAKKIRGIFRDFVDDEGELIKGRYHARVVECYKEYCPPRRLFGCDGNVIDKEIDLRKGECFCMGFAVSCVDAALSLIRKRGTVACGVGCGGVKRRIGNFVVCYSKGKLAYVSVEILSK